VKVPGAETFARWPLLLAGVTLVSAGVVLDLETQAPVAFGLWALASAAFGGFMYAEGARHRDWLDAHDQLDDAPRAEERAEDGPVDP
jgi:hypothetical protein